MTQTIRGTTTQGQPYVKEPGQPFRLQSRGKTLVERLWERVEVRQGHECWPWIGARTRGGRYADGRNGDTPQRITYGALNEGSLEGGSWKRTWRAHIVAGLLLPAVAEEVPRDEGEEFILWLRRARRHFIKYLRLEVSHQCDNSLCCNPAHIEWESHEDNLAGQKYREQQREKDPGYVPRCMEPVEAGGIGFAREIAAVPGQFGGDRREGDR